MIKRDYLPLLAEEAAEVIEAAMKIERFGPDRVYPEGKHAGRTNTEALALEVGDLIEIIDRVGLPRNWIARGRAKKRENLKIWGPDSSEAQREPTSLSADSRAAFSEAAERAERLFKPLFDPEGSSRIAAYIRWLRRRANGEAE